MPVPIPVAILGFSTFDRKALASDFQLGGHSRQRYAHVLNADLADLVIADADEPGVLELLQTLGRVQDALFIGALAPPNAAAWMMRPIDHTQVLRELDALLARRDSPRSSPLPLTLPSSLGRGALRTIGALDLSEFPTRRVGDAAPPPRRHPEQLDSRETRRRELEALRRPQIAPRALLVDDSEVALHFLKRQLQGYGVDVDMARDSDRALDLLTHHVYGLVFLDVDRGLDLLAAQAQPAGMPALGYRDYIAAFERGDAMFWNGGPKPAVDDPCEDLRRRLAAMEASTSWKITAPLRWVMGKIKGR